MTSRQQSSSVAEIVRRLSYLLQIRVACFSAANASGEMTAITMCGQLPEDLHPILLQALANQGGEFKKDRRECPWIHAFQVLGAATPTR